MKSSKKQTKEKKNQKPKEEQIDINEEKEDFKEEPKEEEKEVPKTKTNGIFVSGLPYKMEESEIRTLFSKYGEITEFKLPKYQDSGRNIGYCHIYYKSKEEAEKALELDHHEIGSRYLTVQMAKMDSELLQTQEKINPDEVPSDCMTAFVKNLPYDITEQEVGDKFRSCGKIKGIRFVYNSATKHFKGFCYVDFKEHKSLLKALELNGKELKGRRMKIDFDIKGPKAGYKYNNEKVTEKYNKEHLTMLNKKRKNK